MEVLKLVKYQLNSLLKLIFIALQIEILDAKSSKPIGKVYVEPSVTIKSLKDQIHTLKKSLNPHRQAIRQDARGKSLKDSDTIESLNLREGAKLYVRDLGPQISWKGVFLAEYAGPLFVYMAFYARPSFIYSNAGNPISLTTQ